MKITNELKNNLFIGDIPASFFITFFGVYYNQLIQREFHFAFSLHTMSLHMLHFFLILMLFAGLRIIGKLICEKEMSIPLFSKILNSNSSTYIFAAIIFAAYLPLLILLYPGSVANDTWGQLQQIIYLKDRKWIVSDYHPVFDTLLMSAFVLPFGYKAGAWKAGLFLIVLFQTICTCLTFGYSITYVRKKLNVKSFACFLLLLCYILFPVHVASVQTISKDSLNGWIHLLFIIETVETLRRDGDNLMEKKGMIRLFLVSFFCIITKKVELYVVMGTLVITLLLIRNKKPLLLLTAGLLVIPSVSGKWLRITFNIDKGGVQEMLSVPFQQTARYVIEHGDDVTEEERMIIDRVLDYDDLNLNYSPVDACPIKGYIQKGKSSDYVSYLIVWARQGIRHPGSYVSAFIAHIAGWFSYSEYLPPTNSQWHDQLNIEMIPESAALRNEIGNRSEALFVTCCHFLYRIPLIGKTLTYTFYSSFFPLTVLLAACRKKEKHLAVAFFSLFLSLFLGCLLSPVSVHLEGLRYLFPVTYSAPFILWFTMSRTIYPKNTNSLDSLQADAG